MTTNPPLIPRWSIVVIAFADVGGMIYAAILENWIAVLIMSVVLLVILGADVGAIFRAYRGVPETPEIPQAPAPPAPKEVNP